MKYICVISYTLVSLTGNAMDTSIHIKQPSEQHERKMLKRKFNDAIKPSVSPSDKNVAFARSSEQFKKSRNMTAEEMILETQNRLHFKASVLNTVLPTVRESLHRIREELQRIARSILQHNFERATELASLGTSAQLLDKSASLILTHVKPFLQGSHEERDIFQISLAIIGSGTFNDEIISLVKSLDQSADTKGIDCEALKISYKKIKEITEDIEIARNPIQEEGF